LEDAVTERDNKVRRDTLADLKGILSSYVTRQPTDAELRQWIDEARSRNMPECLKEQVLDAGEKGTRE
jgi:hypothetical protein